MDNVIETIAKTLLTPLTLVYRWPDLIRSARSGSILEYTKVTRVEPIALIDHTIAHIPEVENVCNTLTAIFAAYYLQGVALSVNVGNIETIRMLEKLNPSRDPIENVGLMFSGENYRLKLPTFHKATSVSQESVSFSFESGEEDRLKSAMVDNDDSIKSIQAIAANLSTGIMLSVTLEQNGDKVVIPITVRLIATPTKPSTLTQMVVAGSNNRTMKERWHGWRSGELNFIRDIVFCQDIIDAHKEALMNDDSGQYSEIVSRKNKNRLSGLLSLTPSVSTASNIMVLSAETAKDIERQAGMRWSSFKQRQKVFESAYLILVAVVDTRYEIVTLYHRGITLPTDISFKEMTRSGGKKDNIDINEVLKAYQLGDNPSF